MSPISIPGASFTVDGGGATGPLSLAESGVRVAIVDLSVDEAHDRIELHVWRDSKLAAAEPGAVLSVALGDADSTDDVLAAEVAGVDVTGEGAIVTAFASSRRLSATYVGRAYVEQTLADVVKDLLAEAEVDEGEIDASLTLPALHVDPRRSAWGNLHRLAMRTGHQITSTPDGKVSFGPVPGSSGGGGLGGLAGAAASALGLATSDELREGAELLAFRAGPRGDRPAISTVTPATAASWYLLAAEPDSGSGAPVSVDPMFRTREGADLATSAASDSVSRSRRRARVRVPGRPALRAGGVVQARGDDYRVLVARHRFGFHTGYLCDLVLEGSS